MSIIKYKAIEKCLAIARNKEEELHQMMLKAKKDSGIDEYDVLDVDDLSHHDESYSTYLELKSHYNEAKDNLKVLENLSSDKCDAVGFGALVETEESFFLVASTVAGFDFEGKKCLGISVQSPIYQEMVGKQKGDNFIFNNVNYTIIDVI